MGNDDRIDVKVGAQTGELKTGMGEATSLVKSGTGVIQADFSQLEKTITAQTDRIVAAFKRTGDESKKSQQETSKQLTSLKDILNDVNAKTSGVLDSISAGFSKFTGTLALFGTVLAGGAWFKSMISDTVAYVGEAKKLHEVMAININDAAAYNLAYKRVGISHEDLEGVLKRFQVQVRTNSERLKELGLNTEDIRSKGGGLREMFEKSKDVIRGYSEGIDRNMAAQEIWGARVNDVNKFLKVNADSVANAKKFLEELGLTIGPDMEKQIRQFKQGMVDADTVMLALKVKVAQEVFPQLRKLQDWFAGEGGNAVKNLTTLINGLANAFGSLKTATGWIYDHLNVWRSWQRAAESVARTVNAVRGMRPQPTPGSEGFGDVLEPEAPKSDGGGGKKWDSGGSGGGGGGKTRLQKWQQELEEMKVAEKAFLDYSKAQEREFWQSKLLLCKEGSEEERQVRHRIYQLSKEMAKQEVQEEIAAINLKQTSEKTNMAQRLALEDQKLALLAAKYGQDSQQYRQGLQQKQQLLNQAEKEAIQLEQKKLENQLKLAQMDLDIERQKLQAKRELGKIGAIQEMTQLRLLKEQEIQLEMNTLEQLKAIWGKYPKERQKYEDQIKIAEKKGAADRQKQEDQAVQATKNKFQQIMAPLNQAINSSVTGVMQGTQQMSQAINNALQNILVSYLSMAAQGVANWIAAEAAKTAATLTGTATRSTMETTANAAGTAAKGAASAASILSSAAEGAAAAYSSVMDALPFPINVVAAPIAAAGTFTAIVAYKAMIPSAAMGWDIPADSLAYVHEKEMILPADLSERIRTMTSIPAAPGRSVQISKLHFAPTLVLKERMTHAYAEEITRKFLFQAFQNELDRFGVNLGRS